MCVSWICFTCCAIQTCCWLVFFKEQVKGEIHIPTPPTLRSNLWKNKTNVIEITSSYSYFNLIHIFIMLKSIIIYKKRILRIFNHFIKDVFVNWSCFNYVYLMTYWTVQSCFICRHLAFYMRHFPLMSTNRI